MQDTVNRMVRNGATSYVSMVVTSACGFVMIPITLRYLGKEEYGLLVLVGAIAGYVSLSGLGIGAAIMRSVAEARSAASSSNLSSTISTAFFFYLFTSILGLAATLLLIHPLPHFFQVPQDKVGLSQALLLISLTGAWATFPLSVYTGVLTGRERFDLTNLLQAGQAIVWLLAGVLVLWSGGRLVAFLVTRTATSLLFALAGAWLAHRELPSLRLSSKMVRLSELRHLLSFGIFVFCVHVAVQVTQQADAIVIGVFLPLGTIAVYNIGLRLSEIAREIPAQLGRLLPPVIVGLDRGTQPEELRTAFEESTKWILAVALAAATPLIAFAEPLIRAWVGEGFSRAALVVYILCIGGIVSIGQSPASYILMFKGRHKLTAGLALADCVPNLILSIILIRPLGIVGVALGTTLPIFIMNIFVNVPLACRLIDMPVRRLLRGAVLPALAPAVVTLPIAIAVQRVVWPDHLFSTMLGMAATAAVYTLLFATASLSSGDRARYLVYLRGAVRYAVSAGGRS
jgi:O-antigen/teichoic acid export membrane protein